MKAHHSYSAKDMGRDVLETLAMGPAAYAAFRAAFTPARSRKCWYLVQAMREDGLVRRTGPETYELTERGREALADLRDGMEFIVGSVASVRVFAPPAEGVA